MKIEVGKTTPEYFAESWPGEYNYFSHFEHAAVVPQPLCMITTRKKNGMPNAAFHSGVLFSGGPKAYYAILSNQSASAHTYNNIMREKEFCINYISSSYYEACRKTIKENRDDNDELAAGGFTAEQAKTIDVPRINEAFLSFECKLASTNDLTGDQQHIIVIGEVQLAVIEEAYYKAKNMCGENGFMFNIPGAQNAITGQREKTAMAVLDAAAIYFHKK